MSQIEEISKLYAKEQEFNIPKEPKEGQEQITMSITPLSLEDMSVMDFKEDAPISEISKNAIKLFSLSLGVPEEKVKKISFEYLNDILNAVLEVNNFGEQEKAKVDKLKKFMKDKTEKSNNGITA